jgi:hypothetical protein
MLWKTGQTDVRWEYWFVIQSAVSKTRAKNVHTQLTSGNTVKLRSGQKAIQSDFVDNGTIPRLGRGVWGKIHFIVYQLENGQKRGGKRELKLERKQCLDWYNRFEAFV